MKISVAAKQRNNSGGSAKAKAKAKYLALAIAGSSRRYGNNGGMAASRKQSAK
jgi:hypothetical protein